MLNKILAVLLVMTLPVNGFAALQDLDEAISRKDRYASAIKYSGEVSGNNYTWQPETLTWLDTTTNKEVWRLTFFPNGQDVTSKEHAGQAWSGDGSRLGFWDNSVRDTTNTALTGGNDRIRRWIMNTDGSGFVASDGAGLYSYTLSDFDWLHTERATYLAFSSHAVLEGQAVTKLLKSVIGSTNHATNSVLFDTAATDSTAKFSIKNGISGTDAKMTVRNITENSTTDPNTGILSSSVYFIDLSSNSITSFWGVGRDIGTYGDSHQSSYETRFHDAWAINGNWILGDYSAGDIFALFKSTGSSTDGGPQFSSWDGDSWGATGEVKVVSDGGEDLNNPYSLPYFGHPTIDQWGKYILMGTYTDTPDPGTRIFDIQAVIDSDDGTLETNYPLHKDLYDGSHHSWAGWTDYVVGVDPTANANIKTGLYTSEAETTVVTTDFPGYTDNYNMYPRPVQSPDGTKIVFAHGLFVSNYGGTATRDDYQGISMAVAYYPHPPEITSVTGSGTYTVRFDWRTDQATSRGYTQRGWPSEATDDPPPPRETKSFRLWRSANGTDGWVPVSTTTVDIFERYNFKTGVWSGNNYWTITDTPGAGTWYYAVTSIEHSGLESRVLSNVFSTAGSQTAAYPADPKAATGITATYNQTLIRHYNIYAHDGSAPTIQQQQRIASIPVASGKTYLDWLGDPEGLTQYKVTAVDTQGNESDALSVSYAHQATPGQYLLSWSPETWKMRNTAIHGGMVR